MTTLFAYQDGNVLSNIYYKMHRFAATAFIFVTLILSSNTKSHMNSPWDKLISTCGVVEFKL